MLLKMYFHMIQISSCVCENSEYVLHSQILRDADVMLHKKWLSFSVIYLSAARLAARGASLGGGEGGGGGGGGEGRQRSRRDPSVCGGPGAPARSRAPWPGGGETGLAR